MDELNTELLNIFNFGYKITNFQKYLLMIITEMPQ
jgi:hypothetical protein